MIAARLSGVRSGQANAHKDVMAQVEELGYRTYGSLRKPWKNL
jgi:hypothetical protein